MTAAAHTSVNDDMKDLGAVDVADWYSACLAHTHLPGFSPWRGWRRTVIKYR